ncbi:flavodoxin family protein [Clostridium paraputrificum]|uniref:flavodoxin family protein n=1 Tax=Clostridium paraputrificum TaxID=29363 RepID=UPI003D338892
MKIIVLNGSPKGDESVTMQYIKYIQKKFINHELKIINIAYKINQLEKDEKFFNEIIDEINNCHGVIWGFPVYFCLVSSQYKRFIELIFERNVQYAFKDKYTSLLCTSINYFDHTAINYMNSICDDLEMNFIDYFSAKMMDLKNKECRKLLILFAENFFNGIETKVATLKNYRELSYKPVNYSSVGITKNIDNGDKKILIIADTLDNNNLKNMVYRFKSIFTKNIDLVLLEDISIKGGCLGCIKCGYSYKCAYTDKDSYIDFVNTKVRSADIILFAGAINDRYLSSMWKKFYDRLFFNTHTPSISGKQVAWIISGPLSQIPNIKEIIDGLNQWQISNLVGFLTDEYNTCEEIDDRIYCLAKSLVNLSNKNYIKPMTYLGKGGIKIFRDDIYADLRFPFVADHKAFKDMGIYDFPHKRYLSIIRNSILIFLSKFPKFRNEIYSNQIKVSMIKPFKKILENPKL